MPEGCDSLCRKKSENGAESRPQLHRHGDAFDLCLYNAGMDPHASCALGGLAGIAGIADAILAERERLVFAWCQERGLPIAFVLAGGYVGRGLDQRGWWICTA